MDVKLKDDTQNFKFRVNSIILNNDKVLMVEMNNNNFLCLPGGHVHLGEDTKSAVIRETMEEVGITSPSPKLVGVIENFFTHKTGRSFHELSFYYLMEDAIVPPEKQIDYNYLEHDEDKIVDLKFHWIPLDKVEKYDIRPVALKQILKNRDFTFHHILIKEK